MNRLRTLRKESGRTQAEVAKGVGLSCYGYQKLESGASKPSCDTLIALSKYYGVTVDHLLDNQAS